MAAPSELFVAAVCGLADCGLPGRMEHDHATLLGYQPNSGHWYHPRGSRCKDCSCSGRNCSAFRLSRCGRGGHAVRRDLICVVCWRGRKRAGLQLRNPCPLYRGELLSRLATGRETRAPARNDNAVPPSPGRRGTRQFRRSLRNWRHLSPSYRVPTPERPSQGIRSDPPHPTRSGPSTTRRMGPPHARVG